MSLQGIILLGTVSAGISYTVAEMKIFDWLRNWAKQESRFLHNLLSCSYCTGVWISAILELIFLPNVFSIQILGHIFTWIIIFWISAFECIIMDVGFKIAGK